MRKMEMEEGREGRSLQQEKNMEKDEEMRGKESEDVEEQEGKRVSKEERMKQGTRERKKEGRREREGRFIGGRVEHLAERVEDANRVPLIRAIPE